MGDGDTEKWREEGAGKTREGDQTGRCIPAKLHADTPSLFARAWDQSKATAASMSGLFGSFPPSSSKWTICIPSAAHARHGTAQALEGSPLANSPLTLALFSRGPSVAALHATRHT